MLKVTLVNVTRSEKFWEIVYTLNPKIVGGYRGVLLTEVGKASGFKIIDRQTVSQFGFPSVAFQRRNKMPVREKALGTPPCHANQKELKVGYANCPFSALPISDPDRTYYTVSKTIATNALRMPAHCKPFSFSFR